MYKRICVIGLGRFGTGVATELYQAGHDVLVIDRNEEKVQSMLGKVTYAISMDATTDQALSRLGIEDYDAVILALGEDNVRGQHSGRHGAAGPGHFHDCRSRFHTRCTVRP